jgi:hypothetical protein
MKQVEMSDSRRWSSAGSENMREQNYKNLFAAGRSVKNVPRHYEPIQCQAMLICLFELHMLPKVSKTVGILSNTHMYFE